MAFQKAINITQALAVEGDFASSNPRMSLASVEGGFKAGTGTNLKGVYIARFVWADVATNTLVLNTGTGNPSGFLHRAMEGTTYAYFTMPGSASFFIPSGFPVGEIFVGGDFWVRHTGTADVAVGMTAWTKNAHTSGTVLDGGTIQFASAASITGWTATKWIAATACGPNELCKMSSFPLG